MENKKRRKTDTHHGRNSRNFPSRRKAFQYTTANSLEGSIIYVELLYRKTGKKTSPNPESAYLPVFPIKLTTSSCYRYWLVILTSPHSLNNRIFP
jgi:hypothetical protein